MASRVLPIKSTCCSALFVGILSIIPSVMSAVQLNSGESILENYRPLAMDESWKLVGPMKKPFGRDDPIEISGTKELNLGMIYTPTDKPRIIKSHDSMLDFDDMAPHSKLATDPDELADIADWEKGSSAHRLYKLPKPEAQFPSKVIADSKDPTTFVMSKVQYPEMMQPENGANGKIIAKYRILVPIFIPALKKKITISTAKPVKFVKETVTEMVPIKQIVPHVKEVVKAEPVPQSLITDFVQAEGHKVPKNVDDKIKPNEHVLSSVIQNVD